MLDNYLRKYFIMGSQNCDRDPALVLEDALRAGITAFQFREKGPGSLSGREKVRLGRKLRALCAEYRVPFFVNDDVEFINELDADGIHVGQDDVSVADLRIDYPGLLIGLSVSNKADIEKSPIHMVDYVGAGPIYQTSTKVDAKEPVGLEFIRLLRAEHPYLPVVGIGGITVDNAKEVLEAGANGVAVISAISCAGDVDTALAGL